MTEDEKQADLLIPRERRDYPRVNVSIHVKYKVIEAEDKETILTKKFDPEKIFESANIGVAANVSTSGLLMYTNEEIPLKNFIAINMYLPLPGLSCACRVLAEVIRCEKQDERYELGVKFLKVLHHDLNRYKFLTLTDLLEITGENIKID